jgi:hypothetical protein
MPTVELVSTSATQGLGLSDGNQHLVVQIDTLLRESYHGWESGCFLTISANGRFVYTDLGNQFRLLNALRPVTEEWL